MSHSLSLLLPVLLHLLPLALPQPLHHDDLASLLSFNHSVTLTGWSLDAAHPCSWTGVTCTTRGDTVRVTSLNITGLALQSCQPSWVAEQSNVPGPTCNVSPCRLTGYLPPALGNLTELQSLVLPYHALSGEVPRELARLSRLQVLELQQNEFSGGIPEELGNLSTLEVLNLEGNSLEGPVPSLAGCSSLELLRLGGNKLSGEIPASLGGLPRLRHLSLPSNELNQPVPAELHGVCETLEYLDLGNNFFIRNIPAWLGNCSKLEVLVLKSNYFLGSIPSELGRLSRLRVLDVSMNRLTGQVPASLGSCSELTLLVLSIQKGSAGPLNCTLTYRWGTALKQEFNQFPGQLPGSITLLPKLEIFWSPGAALSGDIPDGWGACRSLRSLNLAGNNFTGNFPRGLGRCESLTYLDVSSNRLQGELPGQLRTSCMVVFNVSRNRLSGKVPSSENVPCSGGPGGDRRSSLIQEDAVNPSRQFLATGSSLCERLRGGSCSSGSAVMHDLSRNNFSGPVPSPLIGDSLLGDQPVYLFLLSDNKLSGNIPAPFFAACGRLTAFVVDLSVNGITDELPGQAIGECTSLLEFNASNNLIGNTVPGEFGRLQNLTLLDLSGNRLTGGIPPELGDLQMLRFLVLSRNSLSGGIPEFSFSSSLSLLDLSSNGVSGGIPPGLGNLTHLEYLLLNNNSLSGTIPQSLSHITSLVTVNLSFNNLSGSIPSTGSWVGLCDAENFQGNPYLQPCTTSSLAEPAYMEQNAQPVPGPEDAGNPSRPGLSIVVIVAITSGCAVAVVLIVLALLVHCTKHRVPSPPGNQGGRKEVVTFTSISFRFTYENVVRATGNFSVDYLIGNGGFGATYKAEMMPGLVVAVKRLAIGRFQGVQQFDTEIRTLGRIRHPNLVTLIGYHASEAEMFLIYNYFPRGNLDSFIHKRSRGEITWQVVHKIALGIAEALAYLHDDCVPKVLHRDIKPSNILLDNNLTAFLSDFGLARLLGASETHATTDVAGTFGYVAPEYAMTCRVSEKADVYSYGVVLLELLSGKKALDVAFSDYGHGFNIVGWACLLIGQGRAHEVFIVELWEMGPENYLLETLKLAVMCTVDSLSVRPTMRQVVDRLRHIQSCIPFP